MLPMAPNTVKAIITLEQAAGYAIHQIILKVIYELVLGLAYALFTLAILNTFNLDSSFKPFFMDYLNQPSGKAYIITLVILGVITLSFAKAYNIDTELTPIKKKAMNFIEDVFRGIIYVTMLIFLTSLVIDHSENGLLIVAYVLYIVSGTYFFLVRTAKWFYFLCGDGKDNLEPWSSVTPAKFHAEDLSVSENELVNRLMSGLIEDIKKGALTAAEKSKNDLI